jgi:tetratricopeptide (TPR) repeat protein
VVQTDRAVTENQAGCIISGMSGCGKLVSRIGPIASVALAIGLAGCEKKPANPAKEPAPSEQPVVVPASRPTEGLPVSLLPSDSRIWERESTAPTTFPADLPDNPEIPKPDLPSLSPAFAREVVGTYMAAAKAPEDADKIGELGTVFHRLNQEVEAVKCFSRAVKLAPRSFKWRYYLAVAFEGSFDPPSAIVALKEASAIDPNYHAAFLRLGDLTRPSDPKAARAYYNQALKLNPGDARVLFGLGKCDLEEGHLEEAFRNFDRAAKLAPRFADAHRELKKYYEGLGDKKQAGIHQSLADQGGQPAVINDPLYVELSCRLLDPGALMALSKQLVDAGQPDLAIRILERGLVWNPKAGEVRQQLGVIYLQNGRFQDAYDSLQAVFVADPSLPYIRSFLAQALIELGRFSEADKMLKAAMDSLPDQTDPAARYADFLLTVGRAKEAEEMYGRLIKAEPANVLNKLGRIESLISEKNYKQAAEELGTITRGSREGYDIADSLAAQLALLLAEQRKPDPGNTRKTSLTWEDLDAFANELSRQGLAEEGKRFRNVPATVAAHLTAMSQRGEFAQAARLAQKVMPVDRGGRIRDAFRSVYLALLQKHADVAAGFIRDCVQNAEVSPHLAIAVAWIRATSSEAAERQGAQAVSLAEKACTATNNSDPEFLDTLAAAYAEAGRFDDAVRTVQRAIQVAGQAKADDAVSAYKARLALYESKKSFRSQ